MRCAIAIFAKTLGRSDVKTRLAADIGREKAEEFYGLSVDCVEAFVNEAGEAFPEILMPVWALAEEDGADDWGDRAFPAIWTGEGGLGTRLASVSSHLFESCDAVMMIGTDSPQLEANRLIEALSLLVSGMSPCIAGPAKDGGFYLFGSSLPIQHDIWEAVTYSSSKTLDELSGLLDDRGLAPRLLDHEQDVDTVSDLKTLYAELSGRQKLSEAQVKLLKWLNENLSLF